MQDVVPDLFSTHREHCQCDKGRCVEDKGGVTDCAASPRSGEISGLARSDRAYGIYEVGKIYRDKAVAIDFIYLPAPKKKKEKCYDNASKKEKNRAI